MTDEVKKGGVPSRSQLYTMASKYAPEAIEKLKQLMTCGTPAVEMGAAKVLLAKAIPDLKAMEITGAEGAPVKVVFMPQEIMDKYAIPSNTVDSSEGQHSV